MKMGLAGIYTYCGPVYSTIPKDISFRCEHDSDRASYSIVYLWSPETAPAHLLDCPWSGTSQCHAISSEVKSPSPRMLCCLDSPLSLPANSQHFPLSCEIRSCSGAAGPPGVAGHGGGPHKKNVGLAMSGWCGKSQPISGSKKPRRNGASIISMVHSRLRI